MKAAKVLFTATGAAALAFALCASKCETATEIVPFVKEICNDNVDNDTDGKIDCLDSDCDTECEVHVAINQIPSISGVDTAIISGTHANATGIAVTIATSGQAGAATITGNTWTSRLTLLSAIGSYTVTAIASDAQGRHDTAVATFERNN
jgi:hypothetical protein